MSQGTGWFDVFEPEPGIFIIEEPHHVERVKSHLIVGDRQAILIDTGMGIANIRELVESLTDKPVIVVNSHAHWDHVGGNHLFEEIWIHPAEASELPRGFPNDRMRTWFQPSSLTGPLPDDVDLDTLDIPPSKATGRLAEGQRFDLENRTLEVLYCPGHSPGGIVLLDRANGILFSTDVAYAGYLYAYAGSWLQTYHASLSRLADLAPELRVLYPSHNDRSISPALVQGMVDTLERIIAGQAADSLRGDVAVYDNGEVGVYLFPPRAEE
ncbi:MAG: MBL fold metallo-hydrolase [Chloroflexia bacterium]|nr:MBL fold metallo-hydrolase [Chloroflexia bacterium]